MSSRIGDDAIIIDEKSGKLRLDDSKVIRVFKPCGIFENFKLDEDTRDRSDPKWAYIPRTITMGDHAAKIDGSANFDLTLIAEPDDFKDVYNILSKFSELLSYWTGHNQSNIVTLMSNALEDKTSDSDTLCSYAEVVDELCMLCGQLKWVTDPIRNEYRAKVNKALKEAEQKRNSDKDKKSKKTAEERERAERGQMAQCVKRAAEMYDRDEKNKAVRKEAGVMVD